MSKKRKYDITLLEKLKQHQYETMYEGVKILVKPLPEGGENGDMDARLYKSMKSLPLMIKFFPKPKKDASMLERILPYRKMFGTYKGRRIVDKGITTMNVTVESADKHLVPVRIYKRSNAGINLPVFVYFHGGGFFGGSMYIVEQMCMLLVQKYDCVALNVDYRLCPENHYPQPFDDCYSATEWAFNHAVELGADPGRLFVSGDSSGGTLAAAVTLRDLDEGLGMVKGQILIYPVTNLSETRTNFYHGVDRSKYIISKRHEKVFNSLFSALGGLNGGSNDDNLLADIYLQGNLPADHPYASPALGDPTHIPPTLLLFGEHDYLVFDNFAYAQSLTTANRTLKTIVYRGMGHGFADQIGVFPQAEDCMDEIGMFMKVTIQKTPAF